MGIWSWTMEVSRLQPLEHFWAKTWNYEPYDKPLVGWWACDAEPWGPSRRWTGGGGEHRKLLCASQTLSVCLSHLGVLLFGTIYCRTLLLQKNQAEIWLFMRKFAVFLNPKWSEFLTLTEKYCKTSWATSFNNLLTTNLSTMSNACRL